MTKDHTSIKIRLYIFLIITISASIIPFKVFAIDADFYGSNDILFYSPDSCGSTDSSTSTTKLTKSDKLKLIFQTLINGGMNAVQASAVMGNMQAESGFDPGGSEVGGGGYGLAQWTNGRRTNLEKFAAKKGVPVSDITMQIEFLLKEYKSSYISSLNGSDFKDATNITKATTAWMMKFEKPKLATAHLPRRIQAAKDIYTLYSSLAPSITATPDSTTSINTGCTNGAGAVSDNIVQTAIGLALSKPATNTMNSVSDANPAYITALNQYNKGANVADCAIFVGTVMIASGADTSYPKGSTLTQFNYVSSKTDKYKIINSPKVTDLLPGDILLVHGATAHHTMIYTGETPYPAVDASLNQRVPSVRSEGDLTWMLGQSGLIVARLIE